MEISYLASPRGSPNGLGFDVDRNFEEVNASPVEEVMLTFDDIVPPSTKRVEVARMFFVLLSKSSNEL